MKKFNSLFQRFWFFNNYFVPSCIIVLCIFSASITSAQNAALDRETVGVPGNYGKGITEKISEIMNRGKQLDIRNGLHPNIIRQEIDVNRNPKPNPASPEVSSFTSADNTVVNRPAIAAVTNTIGTNFTANTYNSGPGYVPPDAQGCVGPTQIMAIANGFIAMYSKSGVIGGLNTGTDNFFASVLNGSSASDPHVHYDPISQRWFVIMISVATVNRIMIAVSSGPTITSSSSFTFYQFEHDLVGTQPNSDTGGFADYDTFGVDGFALYIGANIFGKSGSFVGTTGYVINKKNLLAGTLTITPFRQLCTATGAGPFTPQGVDNADSTVTTGYFIGVDNATSGLLDVRRITNPGGTPTISGNLSITVPTTAAPLAIASLGSVKLDPDDDRLFQATLQKNSSTGVATLWCSHHIRVTAAGVGSTKGTRDGVRWYEIGNLTTTPKLNQSGTLFDKTTAKLFYTYGTIAVNASGSAVIGATVCGATTAINSTIAYATSGTAGTTSAPTNVTSNTGKYTITFDGSPHRWGDYSAVNLDPADEQTLWAFTETCTGGVWGEQATEILSSGTAPVTKVSAPVSADKATEIVQVIGDKTKGAFFESSPLALQHMKVEIDGGVQVVSKHVDDEGHLTLVVNTQGVLPGSYDITVTNPDGQTSTLYKGFTVISNIVAGKLRATIYPNPVHDQVSVTFTGSMHGNLKMTITDAGGKLVAENKIENFDAVKTNIVNQDVKRLTNGIYFVNLTSEDGSYHEALRFEKN